MSEQLLQQILTELKSTNQRLDRMETEIKEIKKDTALIPQIQRAVLDVGNDITEHDRILGNLKKAF